MPDNSDALGMTPEEKTVFQQKNAEMANAVTSDAPVATPWNDAKPFGVMKGTGDELEGAPIYHLGDGSKKIVRGNAIIDYDEYMNKQNAANGAREAKAKEDAGLAAKQANWKNSQAAAPDETPAPEAPAEAPSATTEPATTPATPAPTDKGAGSAFESGLLNDDSDISTAAHPDAALAGHAVRATGEAARTVGEAANPLAPVIASSKLAAKYAAPAAAGAMRVLSGPVGLVSPEAGSDLKWGANKLSAPEAPKAPVAAPAEKPREPVGEPAKAPPAPATPASAPPKGSKGGKAKAGAPDEFEQQRQREDAAVQEVAKAEASQNDAEAAQSSKNISDRQALADQTKAAEAKRQSEMQLRQTEIDNLNDEISKQKIDPEQWWNSRTGGQKIAGVISMFLGGMASGLGVKSEGPEMIKRAIDQNIEAQKANLANKRAGLAGKESAFGRYMQMSGDARAAEAGARAEMTELAKDKLDAMGLQTKDPIIKARAQQASAGLAGEAMKARHDWSNIKSQMGLRYVETQGGQLGNQEKVLDLTGKQRAMESGVPYGAKTEPIVPVLLPGEASPRYVQGGPESQKRVLAAASATRGTIDSIDQMKKIAAAHPWQSLVSGTGPGGDLQLSLERTISQLYAARGQVLQPNEVIQKITESGLSPRVATSTADYLNRLEQFKRSTMKEANDVISSSTNGQKYFPEGPADFQPGALHK